MHVTERRLVATQPSLSDLRETPVELQQAEGYAHTLAEIWQQPQLWVETARRVSTMNEQWSDFVSGAQAVLLTGSGSSYFVGKCIATALQESAFVSVTAVESGEILMLGSGALPPARPLLVVSFARSGDSPESCGLVQRLLAEEPEINPLLITCNPKGQLARMWGEGGTACDPRVRVLMLDERCCDRSLVMTSSFTSMAIAGLGIVAQDPVAKARYLSSTEALAMGVADLLTNLSADIDEFSLKKVDRMIAVGSGCLHGAALEVSLKMLEMTDGRVHTRAEGCLGLRHGPMCALHSRSLLFLPLSSHPARRAYQMDLLEEVVRKRLGGGKVIIGADVPSEILGPNDLALEMPGLRGLGDEWVAIASVVVGQLLAFLRCRAEGLRPDEPAVSDSITRVVGSFTLHDLSAGVS
jgi:tagatose-6-phosphate ketose/aldose isomerase